MSESVLTQLSGFFFNIVTTSWICPIRSVNISWAILTSFQSLRRSFAIVAYLELTFSANSTCWCIISSATSNWWAWSRIPSIYCQALSRKKKSTLVIYIVPFSIFVTVILSMLVTCFPIWKGLIISSTTGNNGLADDKGTMRLADAKSSADIEKPVLANVEKPIVICYKH